ncbi:integrase core domain protein, partial [Lasius niger]
RQAVENGYEAKLTINGIKLINKKDGRVRAEGKRIRQNLWGLKMRVVEPKQKQQAKTGEINAVDRVSVQTWNERLGHISLKACRK